jgi:hypothetical protein
MESGEHFLTGAVATAACLVALAGRYGRKTLAALGVYGVGLSVFVDLDHFVQARYYVGDWRHLRAVLADPLNAIWGQEWVFEDLEMERERLGSHVVIGTLLVGGLLVVAPPVAALTGVVLAVHVTCDVLRDAGLA